MRTNSIGAIILALATTGAYAQDAFNIDCTSVLSKELLDTTSTSIGQEIILDLKNDICSREFESASSARNYTRSGGVEIKIPSYVDMSVKDAKNRSRTDYSVKDSVFCDQSSREVSDLASNEFRTSTARLALDAFKYCVAKQDGGLFMTYEISEQGRLLRAEIIKRPKRTGPTTYIIEGLSVRAPDGTSAECEIRAANVREKLNKGQPFEIKVPTVNLTCIKTGKEFAAIDLATTDVDFAITMPSELSPESEYSILAERLSKTQKELSDARVQIIEAQRALASESEALEATANKLTQTQSSLGNANSILSRYKRADVMVFYTGDQPQRKHIHNFGPGHFQNKRARDMCRTEMGGTLSKLRLVTTFAGHTFKDGLCIPDK